MPPLLLLFKQKKNASSAGLQKLIYEELSFELGKFVKNVTKVLLTFIKTLIQLWKNEDLIQFSFGFKCLNFYTGLGLSYGEAELLVSSVKLRLRGSVQRERSVWENIPLRLGGKTSKILKSISQLIFWVVCTAAFCFDSLLLSAAEMELGKPLCTVLAHSCDAILVIPHHISFRCHISNSYSRWSRWWWGWCPCSWSAGCPTTPTSSSPTSTRPSTTATTYRCHQQLISISCCFANFPPL